MLTIIRRVFDSWRVWVSPVLFAVMYFFVQLSQLSQYGVSWDEPLHRNWGKIFTLFWRTGDRSLLELMPGNGIQYGPIYFFLNYVVAEYFYNHGWLTYVEAHHILTVCVSAVAVFLSYMFGQMIGGKKTGLFTALFIVLFPQFIAHAHYNPKDIPLMTVVLLTALVFSVALTRHSRKLLICSSFLFGLSVAVKINALLMAPVFGLTYIAWVLVCGRGMTWVVLLRRELPLIVGAIIAGVSALYFFWPSAWGDPMLIPRAVTFFLGENFWHGQVLFLGAEYSGAQLPFYYMPFEFVTAMPLLTLVAFIAGIFVILRRISWSEQSVQYLFLLLWIFFPLMFSMKPGLVRYDGIRQFFFILPAIAVVSALGLSQLHDKLIRRSNNRFAGTIFLGLVFMSLGSQVLTLHPFEGSYRSEILQLLYKQDLDETFQIEYWGATYKQGMEWLRDNADPDPVICVPTAGILVTWYAWRDDFTFECSPESDYVMFFTRYTEAEEYRELKDPVFSIQRMKSTLLLVYKI